LAEKFDVAGLVYGITTLEKLRWSLKNSDRARPLLEAAILRLAMSEHFPNAEQLLSQPAPSQGKKKVTANQDVNVAAEQHPHLAPPKQGGVPQINGLESIESDWQGILSAVGKRLGPGTAGLLACARPVRFENGTLTLEFAVSSAIQKRMCENNGRIEQVESVLRDKLGTDLRIELKVAEAEIDSPEESSRAKTRSQRQNEILNDPAVKTVIMGLDATVTGIEDG
jgi:hypothetical protein